MAHIELGDPAAGRAAAETGVRLLRESRAGFRPDAYPVLARAQLALDEYAALLSHTKTHLAEGELHELQARVFDRDGRTSDKQAALRRACDCYTRFGMTAQAARVAEALGQGGAA
jgi:hypothetical protein